MEWRSQNKRNDWPSCDNDFETVRLRGFAAPGSPPGSDRTEKATAESGIDGMILEYEAPGSVKPRSKLHIEDSL